MYIKQDEVFVSMSDKPRPFLKYLEATKVVHLSTFVYRQVTIHHMWQIFEFIHIGSH